MCGLLQFLLTNRSNLLCRINHPVKEPDSSLHRFSQRRRRTYSDTESYSDTLSEDSQSKFEREGVFFVSFCTIYFSVYSRCSSADISMRKKVLFVRFLYYKSEHLYSLLPGWLVLASIHITKDLAAAVVILKSVGLLAR